MLVFFIHGVATRDVKYADSLKDSIRKELVARGQPLPHFYSSFWGDILSNLGKAWNWVDQDLQLLKHQQPTLNLDDAFRYQSARRGFLSEFIGDAFTYLSSERGAKIRELLAQQLEDFIAFHPEETELHLVAHSLGTVILWDVLFSEKLDNDRQACKIRSMIYGFGDRSTERKVHLRSITTMGAPILLFNLMIEANPERIKNLSERSSQPLKWTNIIHASDIIAYPICSSFRSSASWNLAAKDEFIKTDGSHLENILRNFLGSSVFKALSGSLEDTLEAALPLVPMFVGARDAHQSYFNCQRTTSILVESLTDLKQLSDQCESLEQVVQLIRQVPGFNSFSINSDLSQDELLLELPFREKGGILKLSRNLINVHFIEIFDSHQNRKLRGHVGWTHTDGLKKAVEEIRTQYC